MMVGKGAEKGKAKDKSINRLKDRELKKLPQGRHHDGGGLYVNVTTSGTKSFVFVWTKDSKRNEIGLGRLRDKANERDSVGLTLEEARDVAALHRKLIANGGDPRHERERAEQEAKQQAEVAATAKTFGTVALEYIRTFKVEWRNAKHQQQWKNTLQTYCVTIWDRDVASVSFEDVKAILSPIWTSKAETASRLRGRIEAVLSYAQTNKWRDGANPATWSGNLENVLPKRQKLQRGAMKAMPYAAVPAFYQRLCDAKGRDALALRFTILNASRSGEVRLAVWSEIDWKEKQWIIPGERMKRATIFENKPLPHVVPLSDEALRVLEIRREAKGTEELIFPGSKVGKPLSDMTLTAAMRRWELPFHVHGFRSSFRDWAGATTNAPFDVIEKALAHAVGNAVTRAYFRDPLIDKRRELMDEWAEYLTTKPKEKATA
ncbi:MAG: tyrosine-type recombinase/integrase [Allorhizobium sp.]